VPISAPHFGHFLSTFGRPGPAPNFLRFSEFRRAHSRLSTSSGMVVGSMLSDHFRISI
jgi:hypothetical protein